MVLTINGEKKSIDNVETLSGLLGVLGIPAEARGIAVALNETVVPRAEWESARIGEGDAVEIIRAVQGG
jgi:sulfur carrier protein